MVVVDDLWVNRVKLVVNALVLTATTFDAATAAAVDDQINNYLPTLPC